MAKKGYSAPKKGSGKKMATAKTAVRGASSKPCTANSYFKGTNEKTYK